MFHHGVDARAGFVAIRCRSTAIEFAIFHKAKPQSQFFTLGFGAGNNAQPTVVELAIRDIDQRVMSTPIMPPQHTLRHVLRDTQRKDALHVPGLHGSASFGKQSSEWQMLAFLLDLTSQHSDLADVSGSTGQLIKVSDRDFTPGQQHVIHIQSREPPDELFVIGPVELSEFRVLSKRLARKCFVHRQVKMRHQEVRTDASVKHEFGQRTQTDQFQFEPAKSEGRPMTQVFTLLQPHGKP